MLNIFNSLTKNYGKRVNRTVINSLLTLPKFNLSSSSKEPKVKSYALEGVRVLDLTRIVAGPFCTMILADLGADVIKVERPKTGDESRKWGPPFLKNSSDSVYFTAANRNKRSVCIDIKRGASLIKKLAKKSDILMENYVPGKLKKYGLDYESLKKIAPHLIYCSLTGYGQRGPYRNKPGVDVIAASYGGLLDITGSEDGPPAKVGVAITDLTTGLYAHGAILASLLHRQKTGCGQYIDVNLLSTQVACLINVAENYLIAGKEAKRWGTAHESIVPYQSFKTTTGYITIAAVSDDQFKVFCELLSLPDLPTNPKFHTNQDRVKNRAELIEMLSKTFEKNSTEHWLKLFENAPLPTGPVNSVAQVFDDPHIKEIDIVKTVEYSNGEKLKIVGPPVSYSLSRNDVRFGPPSLGQHTDEILTEVLELLPDEIEELKLKGIVQ